MNLMSIVWVCPKSAINEWYELTTVLSPPDKPGQSAVKHFAIIHWWWYRQPHLLHRESKQTPTINEENMQGLGSPYKLVAKNVVWGNLYTEEAVRSNKRDVCEFLSVSSFLLELSLPKSKDFSCLQSHPRLRLKQFVAHQRVFMKKTSHQILPGSSFLLITWQFPIPIQYFTRSACRRIIIPGCIAIGAGMLPVRNALFTRNKNAGRGSRACPGNPLQIPARGLHL